MTHRYKFQQKNSTFEVIGIYGKSIGHGFSVSTLVEGATRMMRALGNQPSGVKIEKFIQVESEEALLLELRTSYPNMTDFGAW